MRFTVWPGTKTSVPFVSAALGVRTSYANETTFVVNVLRRIGTPLVRSGRARALQLAKPMPTAAPGGVRRNGSSRAASVAGFQMVLFGWLVLGAVRKLSWMSIMFKR